MSKQPRVEITIGKPSIIAQSDLVVKTTQGNHWGYWQFPCISIQENGDYLCSYHVNPDHPASCGLPRKYAISKDQGKTWSDYNYDPKERVRLYDELELPNGDRMRAANVFAPKASDYSLPEPIYTDNTYGWKWKFYQAADVAPELTAFYFERRKAGSTAWETELIHVDIPERVAVETEGLFEPACIFEIFSDPDGSMRIAAYAFCRDSDGKCRSRAVYARSRDNGHTFEYLGAIPYQPIPEADAFWDKRTGYFEPGTTFLPDGSMVTLLRTMDFCVGPMHISHSKDGGQTWSRPEFFDDVSVCPHLLTLKNGVTLTLYGRPGQYVRATADSAGKDWDERVAIVPPNGQIMTETCSNATMAAIDDNTVYVVYSDFQCPNPEGVPVKSIMGCTVTTRILE